MCNPIFWKKKKKKKKKEKISIYGLLTLCREIFRLKLFRTIYRWRDYVSHVKWSPRHIWTVKAQIIWHIYRGCSLAHSHCKLYLFIAPDKALFFNHKLLIFSSFLHRNLCFVHSFKASQRGALNEYPQHMFSWRNKKNNIFGLKKSILS